MTVVPGKASAVLLICDRCGNEDNATKSVHDHEVVWPAVWELGWTGSPFATGSHRCPGCSMAGPSPLRSPSRAARGHGTSYAIRVHDDGRTGVITPLTDLDAELAEQVHHDLMRMATKLPHVIIDLHTVRFIDSAGLGLLVRAWQQARQHEASLDLVAPSRFVLTVLHTMRLDGIFQVFPDLETAVDHLRTTPPAGDGVAAEPPPDHTLTHESAWT